MLVDLVNEVISVNGLLPQSLSGSTQGASADFSNGEISTHAILDVGAYSGTTMTVQIEESVDGSTNWTAIPGMVFAAVTATGTHQVVRGLRTHRYVRANALTVNATAILASVEIIAQKKYSGTGGGYSRLPST